MEFNKRRITFPESVLLRPAMYTMNGKFEEVLAFLIGYYSGKACLSPTPPEVLRWNEFESWLSDQLDVDDSRPWARYEKLAAQSQTPLETLASYLKEFEDSFPPED